MTQVLDRPGIDPRMADRRHRVARDHRRRRLQILVGVLVVMTLAGTAVGAARSPLLDVDHIEVSGATRTGTGAVLEVLGFARGDQMTDVDPGAARRAVAALPWVASVSVQRSWPSTVRVEVRERVPAAVAGDAEAGWFLLDRHGRVLEPSPDFPPDLTLVEGAALAPLGEVVTGPERLDELLEVAAAVPPALRAEVDRVRVGPEGDIELGVIPVGRVRLGDTAQLEEKLAAGVVLFQQVDDRCIMIMDLRVPEAPTIARDPACAGPDRAEAAVVTQETPAESAPDGAGGQVVSPQG